MRLYSQSAVVSDLCRIKSNKNMPNRMTAHERCQTREGTRASLPSNHIRLMYNDCILTRERAGNPNPQRAGSPNHQRAGSPNPQRAGSPNPQRADSPNPQRDGSPNPWRAGTTSPQRVGTSTP